MKCICIFLLLLNTIFGTSPSPLFSSKGNNVPMDETTSSPKPVMEYVKSVVSKPKVVFKKIRENTKKRTEFNCEMEGNFTTDFNMTTQFAWEICSKALKTQSIDKRWTLKTQKIDEVWKTVASYGEKMPFPGEISFKCNQFVTNANLNELASFKQTRDQLTELCLFANASMFVYALYQKLKAGRETPAENDQIFENFDKIFNTKSQKYGFSSDLNYFRMGGKLYDAVKLMAFAPPLVYFSPMNKGVALALSISILCEFKGGTFPVKILWKEYSKFYNIKVIFFTCEKEKYTVEYFDLCSFGIIIAFLERIFQNIFMEQTNFIGVLFKHLKNEFNTKGENIGWNFEDYSLILQTPLKNMELNDNEKEAEIEEFFNRVYLEIKEKSATQFSAYAMEQANALIKANAGDLIKEEEMHKQQTLLEKMIQKLRT